MCDVHMEMIVGRRIVDKHPQFTGWDPEPACPHLHARNLMDSDGIQIRPVKRWQAQYGWQISYGRGIPNIHSAGWAHLGCLHPDISQQRQMLCGEAPETGYIPSVAQSQAVQLLSSDLVLCHNIVGDRM